MRTPGPMTMLVENRIDEKSLSLRNRLSVPDFPFATAMISPDSSMNGALVVTAGGGGGGGETSNGLQMFGVAVIAGVLGPIHPSAI